MKVKTNNHKYKILTKNGFRDFMGVSKLPPKFVYKLILDNQQFIRATADHLISIDWYKDLPLSDLKVGQQIMTMNGMRTIVDIVEDGIANVYDVLDVGEDNKFFANSMLVHNCRFIGKSKTLIKSEVVREIIDTTTTKTYSYIVDDDVRFYKELNPRSKYVLAIDPSMGVQGDKAAIQIFEFPCFEQVGEWQSDQFNQNDQVEKVRAILEWMHVKLRELGAISPKLFWTFENNTVGEGFLCCMRERSKDLMSESSYINRGTLIQQSGNKRLGFTTDKRTKSIACTQLKTRIESFQMKINSKYYAQQLSNFTLKEVGYSAAGGNNDDLISASLLVIMLYLQESMELQLDVEAPTQTYSVSVDEFIGNFFDTPFMIG